MKRAKKKSFVSYSLFLSYANVSLTATIYWERLSEVSIIWPLGRVEGCCAIERRSCSSAAWARKMTSSMLCVRPDCCVPARCARWSSGLISTERMICGVTVITMSLWLRVWLGAENSRPRIGSIPITGIVARLSPLLSCLTQATTAVIPSWTLEIVVSERLVNEGVSVESAPEASTLLDSSFIFTCT